MTDAVDPHATLYVTDAELIRRLGVPEKIARRMIKRFDADPKSKFPPKLLMFANRRYWPDIQEWMRGWPMPPSDDDDPPEPIGKVYFLASPTHVKIGFSTQSRKRLRNIRNYHYEKLELLCLIVKAPREAETAMHRKFKPYLLPRKREWFKRVPEIEEFAKAHHTKAWREDMA